jgi:hypothetical protein
MTHQKELYLELTKLKHEMDICCYEAIKILQSEEYLSLERYRMWLDRCNSIEADYLLSESYLTTEEYERAYNLIFRMPEKYNYLDRNAHERYIRYFEVLDRTLHLPEDREVDPYLIDVLHGLAREPDLAGIKSRSLIVTLTGDMSLEESLARDPGPGYFDYYLTNCLTLLYSNHKSAFSNEDFTEEQSNTNTLSGTPELTLYPNPVQGLLYIQLDNTDVVNIEEVKIYDMYGRLLRTESNVRLRKTEIDIVGLSAGVYFVNCKLSNGELKTKRIVKE